jgi:ribosome-binding protein aMBF1 (putative translation factor)
MQLSPVRPGSSPVLSFRTVSASRPVGSGFAPRPASPPPAYVRNPPAPPECTLPRDIASRFGRRIRELRQARGMTQVEVAVTFGIDRTFISDVERGRKAVCLPTLEVFALGFGVSLSDLLRGI